MARSGSVDFTTTRDKIIKGALRIVGALAAGETPDGDDLVDADEALNMMIKSWQAAGLRLWTQQDATIFPTTSVGNYSLGSGSTVHATTSFDETTLSSGAALGDSVFSVTDTTGVEVGDNFGVMMDSDAYFWDTVSVVSAAALTVTTVNTLTSAATSGNTVVSYTDKMNRPLRVVNLLRRDTSNVDVPINMLSRNEFYNLPAKTQTGTPVNAYYDPQLDAGTLKLWPEPEDETLRFVLTFQESLQDFDAAADNPDVPQEWFRALKWGLALELAPEYGVNPSLFQRIQLMAANSRLEVETFDREWASTKFQPNMRGRRR